MTAEQILVFSVLVVALALFLAERWRYDVVALLALLAVTFSGIVPADRAFSGFGHPAVVTVAAVLVMSRGLQNAGVVDLMAGWISRVGDRPTLQVAALTGLVAVLSGFVNNVGALALLLPMGVRMARKSGHPPSLLLMPLAFGSLLGGMTTLIGTPPNIIIAMFRSQTGTAPFRMFDFAPVGVGVAVVGLLYISLIGWRLIPKRKGLGSREELFHIQDYITELRVPEDSKILGKPLREVESMTEADITVVGVIRGDWRLPAPSSFEIVRVGDILIVEADSEALKTLLDAAKLELAANKQVGEEVLGSNDVSVAEAIVRPDSPIEGNTAWTLRLRWRYGVNLLGVARQGERLKERLKNIQFKAGDVLLFQGPKEALQETLPLLGCLPLAERGLRIGQSRRILSTIGIFAGAVTAAAVGLASAPVAFVGAAVFMILMNLISLSDAYEAIDWPILVLLGALIPVAQALETTGGAELIALNLIRISRWIPPEGVLLTVLVATMFLSDVINNAAAAVLMAPIAISIARGLSASADPFLMSVAVGASCAFLTPIGHQSNALVMGPAGYRFGDYWRMGLPLECVIAAVAVPLILWFWPLAG
jgi:di/tricarboxylate transporter